MNCFPPKETSRSRWTSALLTPALLATMLSFTALASQNTLIAQEKVGLTGLIPFELPEGITEDDFSALPDSWKQWSQTTIKQLNKLYGFDALSLAQQKETLNKIQGQLKAVDNASEATDQLIDLGKKLHRRVAVLQAVLETLDKNSKQKKKLRPALQKLLQAIDGYEADSLLGQSDTQVRLQVEAIRSITAGNAKALQDTILVYYFNFNVRVYVSGPFAESVFHECRKETGPVCDFILGARVRGTQWTNSGVSINFLPCDDAARFAIQVKGSTTSKTRGVTNQATIYTHGHHYFTGKKVVLFDGDTFSSHRASLSVRANNRVTDAHLNQRHLIAKLIGDKIAYQRAVGKKSETEAIAAQRLRSRVLPQFNREVDNTFGELNEELEKFEKRLAKESIAPDEKMVRTDANELRTAYRLMNNGQLAADRPATVFNSKTGLTIHIHESWINNALAVEGYNFKNPEMSFPDFGEALAEKFRRAFKIDDKVKKAKDDGDRVILSDVDPIHVQFDGGKMKVIMRVGLKSAGRDDIIKLRRVEIPLQLNIKENSISLSISEDENDKVRVLPLDSSDRRPISNRIMGSKIRSKFEERLAGESFDRTFDLPVDEKGDRTIAVSVDSLHAVNGWLVVVLEEVEQSDE